MSLVDRFHIVQYKIYTIDRVDTAIVHVAARQKLHNETPSKEDSRMNTIGPRKFHSDGLLDENETSQLSTYLYTYIR